MLRCLPRTSPNETSRLCVATRRTCARHAEGLLEELSVGVLVEVARAFSYVPASQRVDCYRTDPGSQCQRQVAWIFHTTVGHLEYPS